MTNAEGVIDWMYKAGRSNISLEQVRAASVAGMRYGFAPWRAASRTLKLPSYNEDSADKDEKEDENVS